MTAPRTDTTVLAPPIGGLDTVSRWNPMRQRRQLLEGTWASQLTDRLRRDVGATRAGAWTTPSLARDLYASVCSTLSVLYLEPYDLQHEDRAAAELVTEAQRIAGLQQVLTDVQYYATGMGTCYVRVDVEERDGFPRLTYTRVTPDYVEDWAPEGARQPTMLREYVWRDRWEADEYELGYAADPVYRRWVQTDNQWSVVETMAGDEYPAHLRRADGRAIMPYVLYHDRAPRVGLHDPHVRQGLADGAVDVAVLYAMTSHVFLDASWPQRYILGAQPVGLSSTDPETADGHARREVTTDPASVLLLEHMPGEGESRQVMIGQWQAGGDVTKLYDVLDRISGQLAVDAGISPTDLARTSPNRSAAAIALTKEGQREEQRRAAPIMRQSDERLAAVTATMLNRALGGSLPEGGYDVAYRQMALTPQELEDRRKHVLELIGAGLMSRLEGYRYLHPGITEAEAAARLAAIETPTT